MPVTRRAALLLAVIAVLVVPAFPAAASTAPLPETVLHIKSIDWQPKTGNVAITARVKCTGVGTFQWAAAVAQGNLRVRNSTSVPCDGDGYRSTLILNPRNGRFHPGDAELTVQQIVMGGSSGIGTATTEALRISTQ